MYKLKQAGENFGWTFRIYKDDVVICEVFEHAMGNKITELLNECDTLVKLTQCVRVDKVEIKFEHFTIIADLYKDGDQWCCGIGENLQEGVYGFGPSIYRAINEFNNLFLAGM